MIFQHVVVIVVSAAVAVVMWREAKIEREVHGHIGEGLEESGGDARSPFFAATGVQPHCCHERLKVFVAK